MKTETIPVNIRTEFAEDVQVLVDRIAFLESCLSEVRDRCELNPCKTQPGNVVSDAAKLVICAPNLIAWLTESVGGSK